MNPTTKALLARAMAQGRTDWLVERQNGFATLRAVRGSTAAQMLHWFQSLPPDRIEPVSEALLQRRFGKPTQEQRALIKAADTVLVMRPRDDESPPQARVDRKRLRRLTREALSGVLGPAMTLGSSVEWVHESALDGDWMLRTFVDTGGSTRDVQYDHSLVSEAAGGTVLSLSALGLLGVGGSATVWDILGAGEEESTAQTIARFADRFRREVAPALTKDL
jgi:hypothetical protein